ncbi:MAG: SDR family NAD(P)-dependent oxidoreductase [Deltaproteobacteria bacterium]|jgi:NAD(P)-dependent dehydrogenase (short-subunit alcohol dehydrogenase family)|nr:SDR family NAD(P)-dependent oxidoreductase [Deltaproteobacteria bacterium]
MDIGSFSLDYFSLAGKVALVTGGNSGLGQAFSLALAKAGASILVPSIVEEDGTTRALLEKEGVRSFFLKTDITQKGVPEAVVRECVGRLGTVDILVNCAGICLEDTVLDFGLDKWEAMMAVNLNAAFEMSHQAARVMVPRKSGKIINVCSMFSFLGGLRSPAYAASKHGIAGLTKAYCDELAQHNIQVNGLAPGYFATAITAITRADPVTNQRVLDHIPASRWGERLDLMGTLVFLASRASDYVNGHVLAVDGGYLVR